MELRVMPRVKEMPTPAQVQSELQAILASEALVRAPALSSFLAFICMETLHGRSDQLKEYTIAVEALGRQNDFEPIEDPIVRVQASRLRECLKGYYNSEGNGHPVQIRLPKGHYVPEFRLLSSRGTIADPILTVLPEPATSEPEPHPVPAITARWRWPLAVGILLIVCASVTGFLVRAHHGNSNGPEPALAAASAPISSGDIVRILAGYSNSQYIDQLGRVWQGDRYFRGGHTVKAVYEPLVPAEDRNLWLNYRGGEEFEYDIPLKPGPHELHLYFTETLYGVDLVAGGGEAMRVFDVSANDRKLLEYFDILRDSGGARIADEKVFNDVTAGADGMLHLRFAARSSEAIVNGIEISPSSPHRMRPIRLTTRNVPYASPNGTLWQPDRYYSSGRTHPLLQSVAGTDDPGLYRSERFGNFSYTFPVAQGTYTAILHFNEAFHGPSNPGGGGVGSREFDVYFNGVALLREFDIFKEAGGANRALRKEFHGLKPNALGKLVFTFQPIRNYPSVNAIEIIPE
jgi:hypothetical protein